MNNPIIPSPLTARIEVDLSGLTAQIAEAVELLQQAPESLARDLLHALNDGVSVLGVEFGEAARGAATGANEILLTYRPRLVGDFERAMTALRAEKFDVA